MKIIIVGPAWPLRGGIASFDEELAKSFINDGHHVQIISYYLQYPSILFPGKSQIDITRSAPENLKIHSLLSSVNPWSWYKTAQFVKREQPDMLILRFWIPFMAPALALVSAVSRRSIPGKVIGFADNVIPHEKRPGDKFLTSLFVKACDGFMVMSDAVSLDLRKFDDIKLIRNNPHPIYSHYGPKVEKVVACNVLGLDPKSNYLLFFGFIRKYKGLQILLEAMNSDKIKALGIKLIIAGEFYEDKLSYTDYILKNDLSEHIIIMDEFIPDDKVKYLFAAADMVTQPYLSATQSGVTQIAYHFEKPMIVTNVGGLPEIVPHGKAGYVCEPESVAIENAILDFYNNEMQAELTLGVKEEKKRFSWESMVNSFKELYLDLIKTGKK